MRALHLLGAWSVSRLDCRQLDSEAKNMIPRPVIVYGAFHVLGAGVWTVRRKSDDGTSVLAGDV